jgi:iron complex transport system permease protein
MATLTAAKTPVLARTRARRAPLLWIGLAVCGAALLIAAMSSIAFGVADIHPSTVFDAIFNFNPDSTSHLIIRTLRVPRAGLGAIVGASLAVAGAIMQGITRNPMGDTGILGINAGAAFVVVLAVSLAKGTGFGVYVWFAFAGGAITALTVYTLSAFRLGSPTPLRLTIAGTAVTALLSSLTTAILILDERAVGDVRFWLAGSVGGLDLKMLGQVAPYLVIGLALSLLLGRQITTLALGEDIAKGLGQRTGRIKGLCALCVVLLAGASVAAAGPIGFVGLVIPHVVRFFVGVDYRWILPYSALCGAIFLVSADVVARLVIKPSEVPVGVMTAIIGGPFFVYLVRQKVRR